MKRWKEDIEGIGSIDYIVFKNVPMRESKFGPVVELSEKLMENIAAHAIIENRFPIRGKEVLFLRKSIGMSLAQFSEKLGLTAGAVQRWEKEENERLHTINEAAVRALVADALQIDISGKLSELVGIGKTPKRFELLAS